MKYAIVAISVLAMVSSAFGVYTTPYMDFRVSDTTGRMNIEGHMYDMAWDDMGLPMVGQGITYNDSPDSHNTHLRALDPIAGSQLVSLWPHDSGWTGFPDVDGNGTTDVTAWGAAGEWTAYTFQVDRSGMYSVRLRGQEQSGGANLHVYLDGVKRTMYKGNEPWYSDARLWDDTVLGWGQHTVVVEMEGQYSLAGIYVEWEGVPEPATALLLLGGLPFLRRRRA
jgi:MYXO-CTERM domain-containing protein